MLQNPTTLQTLLVYFFQRFYFTDLEDPLSQRAHPTHAAIMSKMSPINCPDFGKNLGTKPIRLCNR